MRDLRDWMALLAAIGHLSLAATALSVGRQSPLARPLAALCFALFGWNFATLGGHLFGGRAFSAFDAMFTALSPALVLEVVLRFVGKGRRHARARVAAWLAFGTLAATSLGAPLVANGMAWVDGPRWPLLFLILWLPTVAFEVALLVRHLREKADDAESARTRIVLAALAIGATFSTSDIVHGLGLPLPYLGSIGTLVSTGLLATCAIRSGLLDRNVSARRAIYVGAMTSAFVVAYLVLFRLFAESLAAQVFASVVVTLVVVAVARELGTSIAESRARERRLAVLGRFSSQMAHDLRSPLTALIGAVQVLEGFGEEPTPKQRATQKDLLGLACAQAKRISAIVDRYDRMARIEPRKTIVRIDEIAGDVARAHDVETALGAATGECEADADLVASAVDNLVRNAVEATGDPRLVRVETERRETSLVVRVVDRGPGMDARLRERAFEDFFTTKETGSGLGLAFVKRVMLAHGGDVALETEVGVGTTFELVLPAPPSAKRP